MAVIHLLDIGQEEKKSMKKKDASNRPAESSDQVQTSRERPQSPQPTFEPEQAKPEVGNEEIAQRAYAIYEQRGRLPGSELDDWLQAERDLLTGTKTRTDQAA
jgi:hypothetical protein